MSITESESEIAINMQLTACGWQLDPRQTGRNVFKQGAKTPNQNKALSGKRPDYVLYAFEDSENPSVVIEAKKPSKSLSEALEQGIERYANKIRAPIVIASDGWRVKTWHIGCGEPLFLDGREVDELFSPEMAKSFIRNNKFNSFSKEVSLDQDGLIAKFKKANNILKNEGLSAGIERFSEFANLMFLKLKIEGGADIAGLSWANIEEKQGTALLRAINTMFKGLREDHSKLFDRPKVRNPKNMERLIEVLSSFRLSSVKHDIKGLAFEYFIHSYTRGTKNDLGQYFTPRHIVRMMVHFLKPKIGETIYDPFCGTGGMLIECFRYISQHIESTKEREILKEKTVFGMDNSSVARIAMMNMIMFGDGHSNIRQGDSYAMLGETKHKYDVVITNIPFSQETDHYEGYPVMPTGRKNGDSIGVQHCLESLKTKETARAAIIVPIGFLYKENLSEERKYIFENWKMERVVELSPKCFQPYTEQQTAVLVVSRRNRTSVFPYYRVRNDGYSQDGYRIALPGENDIDRTMDDVGAVESPITTNFPSRIKNIKLFVRKNEFRLGDVANVTGGAGNISPKTKIIDVTGGIHPLMMVDDLAKTHIDYWLTESNYKLTDRAVIEKSPYRFRENATIIPVTGKASLKNHRALLGTPAYLTSTLAGIEAQTDRIHPFCLFHFFLNFDVDRIVYDLGYPGISIRTTLVEVGVTNYTDKQTNDIIERVSDAIELSKTLKETRKQIEP